MDWLASVFYYPHPAYNLVPAVMWTTFVVSVAFALFLRKKSWGAAGFLAALIVFVFFSVVLTLYNGVRSTAAIGGMFMIGYVSIVAFPTAATLRIGMSILRKMRAARPASD